LPDVKKVNQQRGEIEESEEPLVEGQAESVIEAPVLKKLSYRHLLCSGRVVFAAQCISMSLFAYT